MSEQRPSPGPDQEHELETGREGPERADESPSTAPEDSAQAEEGEAPASDESEPDTPTEHLAPVGVALGSSQAASSGPEAGIHESAPAESNIEAAGQRRWQRTALMVGLPILALLLGTGLGVAISDPTSSAEYQQLAADRDIIKAERDTLRSTVPDLERDVSRLENEVEDLEEEVGGVAEREEAVADAEAALAEAEEALTVRVTEFEEKEASLVEREAAVGLAEQEAAANSFGNGMWTVGRDIAPGTYRTTSAVTSDLCYWGIYRTGSNGDDIIQNDIVDGGFPQVTLREGQDFKSSDCGTWAKQQ